MGEDLLAYAFFLPFFDYAHASQLPGGLVVPKGSGGGGAADVLAIVESADVDGGGFVVAFEMGGFDGTAWAEDIPADLEDFIEGGAAGDDVAEIAAFAHF